MPSTAVRVDHNGTVARLTLTSEDGDNRIDTVAIDALRSACAALLDDGTTRVVIVAADGHRFSAGWAADALALEDETAARALGPDPFGCLAELPMPVIAEIDGDAISAGLELALACDLRVAATPVRFAFPETAFGLIPIAGGTQRLPRAIGRGRAQAMILLGEMIGAATALDWGLLNAVAEPAALRATVDRLASTVAGRGPIAERFAKEAVHLGVEMPLARALRYELDLTVLLQTTLDRAEGVRAFAEKRPPRFTGA